jgi:enoyl-CoA hydratase/carnithine racemase
MKPASGETTMALLKYNHADAIATMTLCNPPENRLSAELMSEFGAALADIEGRSDTRAVLLNADGPDFCFGGDFTKWVGMSSADAVAGRMRGLALVNRFENLPFPIVAAVRGQCRGGGFELALRADIIIAAEDARFSHPEATIGIFTLLGGVQRVAERVGRTRAIQWAMTSEIIEARKASDIGLINEVVSREALEDRAQEMVRRLASGPTLVHADHKRLLRAWSVGGIAEADALMPEMAGKAFATEDAQGAIKAATDAVKSGLPRPNYDFKGR